MSRRRKRAVSASTGVSWYRGNTALSVTSGLALWAAFPPLGLSLLAWVAPVGWLILIRRLSLPGRAPYAGIWLGGVVHWLSMMVGITYAHPLNVFGWLALGLYLACYVPLFVFVTRIAVHSVRVPLLLAAPAVWTATELVRGYLFTGFSLGLLGHTQYEWTLLIQGSDVFGAYGVSFLVMFVASCLVSAAGVSVAGAGVGEPPAAPAQDDRVAAPGGMRSVPPVWIRRLQPMAWATVLMLIALGYGVCSSGRSRPQPTHKAALIQETFNTRFEHDPQRNDQIFQTYRDSTLAVRDAHPDLDLIVWPESVFSANLPDFIVEATAAPAESEQFAAYEAMFDRKVEHIAQGLNRGWRNEGSAPLNVSLLVGTETYVVAEEPRLHNTAMLISPCGTRRQRYFKMHPVMFGEYIPLANVFPWIYEWTPLHRGLTPGDGPRCFEVEGLRLSPSICFESTVPHLIRGQVARLRRAGRAPDVLVNVTHDGWFWGASILDLQLACAVFRAVELRIPFLVAANAGISAWIDEDGRLVERAPRQGPAVIIAHLGPRKRTSWYAAHGDVFAWSCLLICLGLVLVGRARTK